MKKLTFIIGAGASAEVNFPTGSILKNKIEGMLKRIGRETITGASNPSDPDVNSLISDHLAKRNPQEIINYHDECSYVSGSLVLADSIDAYISSHRANDRAVRILKSCILKVIWNHEQNSPFYSRPNEQTTYAKLDGTWYLPFFKMLAKDCDYQAFKERLNWLNLIIFNYDRCVEQFLVKAIQNYYRVESAEAIRTVNNISIHHPYGLAGNIFDNSKAVIEFGGSSNLIGDMYRLADEIKTFAENTSKDESDIVKMLSSLNDTQILCFFGFSFGEMNMKLLSLQDNIRLNTTRVYATTHKLPQSTIDQVKSNHLFKINGVVSNSHIKLMPAQCGEFFDEYSNLIYSDWIS